jgi:hypothetical protein
MFHTGKAVRSNCEHCVREAVVLEESVVLIRVNIIIT